MLIIKFMLTTDNIAYCEDVRKIMANLRKLKRFLLKNLKLFFFNDKSSQKISPVRAGSGPLIHYTMREWFA